VGGRLLQMPPYARLNLCVCLLFLVRVAIPESYGRVNAELRPDLAGRKALLVKLLNFSNRGWGDFLMLIRQNETLWVRSRRAPKKEGPHSNGPLLPSFFLLNCRCVVDLSGISALDERQITMNHGETMFILFALAALCALPIVVMFYRIVTGYNAMTPEQIAETKRMMAPGRRPLSKER